MINLTKLVIGQEEIDAVVAVMKTGLIAQGPKVTELEEKFAKYCGTKYAVAFNSGTAAIHAGLYAFGIIEGDEVITTPFTFVATANPILMQGGKVIFADISEEGFNLDPAEVAKKITSKTKAIIPVDLYGQIYDYKGLKKVIGYRDIKILEDACQAVGAEQDGKKAGNFGDLAAFSLYATKNIMCGEGGLIATDSEDAAEKCRMFRHHGQSEKVRYEYLDLGYNYRMTDLAAAIALVQLKKIEKLNNKRIDHARKLVDGLGVIPGIIVPKVKKNNKHVFHQFVIRVTPEYKMSRDELMKKLSDNGIAGGIHYPKPLHLHTHFRKMGYKVGDFPVAEKMAEEVLSLPVHPFLTSQEIEKIIATIKN